MCIKILLRCLYALLLILILKTNVYSAEKYIVASEGLWPPFEYFDQDSKPRGFSIDYLNSIGEHLGITFEFIYVPWD